MFLRFSDVFEIFRSVETVKVQIYLFICTSTLNFTFGQRNFQKNWSRDWRQYPVLLSPTGNPQNTYKSSCFSRVFEIFRSVETVKTVKGPNLFIYIYTSLHLILYFLDLEKFSKYSASLSHTHKPTHFPSGHRAYIYCRYKGDSPAFIQLR